MKSLFEFRNIVEEEKSDYSKFDVLVRAGLANKAQMQRIHKILDKMHEERPQFNNADKMILQNLFNKMVDLISNNKQINMQARRAVKEDEELTVKNTLLLIQNDDSDEDERLAKVIKSRIQTRKSFDKLGKMNYIQLKKIARVKNNSMTKTQLIMKIMSDAKKLNTSSNF